MKKTPNDLRALSQKTMQALSEGAWPDYLRVVARTSAYGFQDQLLIFAQKPNVTHCATYDTWTSEPYRRMPRRGTGIALLDETGARAKLRYVFDISDTFEQKGTKDQTSPAQKITADTEMARRRALAEKYLPTTQHTEAHITSNPGQFYRSIAFEIVSNHLEEILRKLTHIQHTCELNMFPELELERVLLNLLTESLSAVFQHRCDVEPEIREEFLTPVKHFNSVEAISILGQAMQHLAHEALAEQTHQNHVHQPPETRNRPEATQSRGEGSNTTEVYEHTLRSKNAPEALKMASEPSEPTQTSNITEEDILRAIQAGPPLEGGKFRIQAAVQDPNTSPDDLIEILCQEYGTGQRPFMFQSHALGNLSWSPSGLVLAFPGPSDVYLLTLPWKRVTAQLNRLVGQNNYLTPEETAHMEKYFAAQDAKQARQRVGAAISALLNIFEPDRSSLAQSQELIRAYASENSEEARQALCGKLLALTTNARLLADLDATTILKHLLVILTDRAEDSHTLTLAEGESVLPKSPEQLRNENVDPTSHRACNGDDLYTVFSQEIARDVCAPVVVKADTITANPEGAASSQDPHHTIHTLRCAISSLLSSQYRTFCATIDEPIQPREDLLRMTLADFTRASGKDAIERPCPQPGHPLCTLDSNSAFLVFVAHEMQNSSHPDVSSAGWTALRLLETHFGATENTLLATAGHFHHAPIHTLSSTLSFGSYDAVHLDGVTYEIQLTPENKLRLTSTQTGETLPPISPENLSNRIRAQIGSRLIPAWSRDISANLYQREDQKLLTELLRHFGTWCGCDSIRKDTAEYNQIQNHLMALRVSEDPSVNQESIRIVEGAIRRFFPRPDSIPERGWDTSRLLSRAEAYLDYPRRPHELEIDHPELLRMDQSRLERSDKVVLADLLHHFGTYQYTFKENTPELSIHDSSLREAEMTQMDSICVSDSIDENLKHIHLAKTILARWFLPFDGIRPEILEQQEILLSAADQLLLDPPKQSTPTTHTHTHTHTYTDNEPIEPEGIAEKEEDSLFHYVQTENTFPESSVAAFSNPVPLKQRLQDAQQRASNDTPKLNTNTKEPALL